MTGRRILCYGDSNTWGYRPDNQQRYADAIRWTSVLAAAIGPDCQVIEEGLNARTTVWDDPIEGIHKNGRSYLLPCLESHAPLDLVILMLGTNDLKTRFSLTAADIAAGAGVLGSVIQGCPAGPAGRPPRLLLVSPILVGANVGENRQMVSAFGLGSPAISRDFGLEYARVAVNLGCDFLDAAACADPSPLDAIHISAGGHQTLGLAIAAKVRAILGIPEI